MFLFWYVHHVASVINLSHKKKKKKYKSWHAGLHLFMQTNISPHISLLDELHFEILFSQKISDTLFPRKPDNKTEAFQNMAREITRDVPGLFLFSGSDTDKTIKIHEGLVSGHTCIYMHTYVPTMLNCSFSSD